MLNLSLNLTKTCRIILLVILTLDSVKITQVINTTNKIETSKTIVCMYNNAQLKADFIGGRK